MPKYTPNQIVKMVDRMERNASSLHEIMDQDFEYWRLAPYAGDVDQNGVDVLAGYRHFTSNDPRTTMNLAVHLVSSAKRLIRCNTSRPQRPQRGINNMKELYTIGVFDQANERRANLLMPPLVSAMAMQCLLRGRRAQRFLLVREDKTDEELQQEEQQRYQEIGPDALLMPPVSPTKTYVDIQDWDPRNTYWGMGKHGVAWACHKVWKTGTELMEEYDLSPSELPEKSADEYEGDARFWDNTELDYEVYDYFDEEINTVLLEGGRELKPATPHGMRRVPVSLGIVGSLPFLQAEGDNYGSEYGHSLYNSVRLMFAQNNFMLSILAELAHRAIKPALNLRSRDGSFTLDEDPRVTGAEVSTSTQNEEDILPIPPVEMSREAGVFLGNIQTMVQRGTFPYSAFGELAIQLSGYAINSLRQSMEVAISATVDSMIVGLTEIGNGLCDAYASGEFDPMTLSGKLQDPQRTYFSEEILPEAVKNGGTLEVSIVPQLPQDDASKMQLARMATEGNIPLVDMRFAREEYLQLQDVDQVERAVLEQMAITASPVALAFKMMMAAAEQGDFEMAQIYQTEFETQLIQKMNELMQVQMESAMAQQQGMGGPMGGQMSTPPGSPPGGPMGMPPEVMPNAAMGGPPPGPTPQQGPLVAPGTPRPGAQGQPNQS